MILQGSIPKNLLIIARPPIEVGQSWDDLGDFKPENLTEVRPAFVSDAENPKTIETGRGWAERHQHYYDWKTGTHKTPKGKPEEFEVPNEPKSGYRVVSLERRGEGGRAWKVISPDGFWFDLREDVLLDTLLQGGVEKGLLKGEFIWARVQAEMKLVRVGSELHKAMIEATQRKEAKKLGAKDFEVGGIYQQKNGSVAIFCGWVASTIYDTHCTGYYRTSEYTVSKRSEKRTMLWCEPMSWDKDAQANPSKAFNDRLKDTNGFRMYEFKLKKSASVIEKIGSFDIDQSKVIGLLKSATLSQISAISRHRTPDGAASDWASLSPLANLAEVGGATPDPAYEAWEKTQPMKNS